MSRKWLRPVLIGVLYLLVWYGLDVASQQFATSPEVTVWYPAVALDVALLLVFGLRCWPLLVLSRLLHVYLVTDPLPLLPLSGYIAAAVGATVGGAWLLLRLRVDPRLPRLRDVALFVAVLVMGAPLVMSALQVFNLNMFGLLPAGRELSQTLQLWAGSATGVGLLAPPLLLLLGRWPGLWTGGRADPPAPAPSPGGPPDLGPPWLTPARIRDSLIAALLVGLALWAGYGGPRGSTLDYSYVLFVPLLWTAARHGFAPAAVTVLALNVGVALLTQGRVEQTGALALQFGLMTVTVSGLLLGAVIRERRRLAAQLMHMTLHDPLTDLGNRRLFSERVAQALSGSPAPNSVAVLLMDFDDFKTINDSLGHGAGDEVLVLASQRLQASVSATDTVARLGGDEFAVLLEHLPGPQQAFEAADRLLRVLEPLFPVQGLELQVRASLGIALYGPASAGPLDDRALLRNADVALYHAKAHRRGRAQVFDAAMHRDVLERLELESDLRAAIAGDALHIHYQPVVDLRGGHLRGFEALVRWHHPTRGLLAPGAFVPLAEQTGLIVALDRWMLRTAAREAARWPSVPGRAAPVLGVNLTAAQLYLPRLAAEVQEVLAASGLPPERLTLELTENVLMIDRASTLDTMRALRRLGVGLALDDFGTGYSSLNYLRRFPISDLKVDRCFIADMTGNDSGTALVRAVADLGHALSLTTVAEGIETAQQYAQVRELGFALAQGFYISRPLEAAAAHALAGQRGPLVTAHADAAGGPR